MDEPSRLRRCSDPSIRTAGSNLRGRVPREVTGWTPATHERKSLTMTEPADDLAIELDEILCEWEEEYPDRDRYWGLVNRLALSYPDVTREIIGRVKAKIDG
jgi:hypothetical protein